jgi:hypothetical protein
VLLQTAYAQSAERSGGIAKLGALFTSSTVQSSRPSNLQLRRPRTLGGPFPVHFCRISKIVVGLIPPAFFRIDCSLSYAEKRHLP